MKNSYKIIIVLILVISLITIIAIGLSGIFTNNSDSKSCLTVVNSSNLNNTSHVSGIKWIEDFQSGINESKKSNKPMLVYFRVSWCSFCKQLESETFTNQEVENKIAENYIPVKIDGDTNPELCSRYNVLGFPTIILIDSNEKKLDFIEGFHSPEELLKRLS